MSINPRCAKCGLALCGSTPMGEHSPEDLPDFCPMKTSSKIVERSVERYREEEIRDIYVPATITEGEAYESVRGTTMAVRPRVKELIEFAKLTGSGKIGIAFCAGLRDEAGRLTKILEGQGFEVSSVMCKCGGIDKELLGVENEYKIGDPGKFEAACNPVLQAELLNEAGVDINVIVGLCLGHDMVFTRESKAPVTTLVVKDRLTGHNPVIALYSAYHRGTIESQARK
jgi:uncharacterized metal-binding protein